MKETDILDIMTVVNVFDNEGYTIDRYTITVLVEEESYLITCDVTPDHPNGIWLVSENDGISEIDKDEDNKHLGKEIEWDDLPDKVKSLVVNYFSEV